MKQQAIALSSYAFHAITRWLSTSSGGGLGASGMRLVDGEVVRNSIVRSDSAGITEGGRNRGMGRLVLEQVPDIVFGELTVETSLHVSDFLRDDGIVVVEGGLLDELLVQHGLEKEIEVRHESSGVTILVLGEETVQSVVDLSIVGVDSLNRGEAREELQGGEESDAVEPARDSNLQEVKDSWVNQMSISAIDTYTGVRLGHSLEAGNMEVSDARGTGLDHVGIEPEVVSAEASQVVLLSVEVLVIHLSFY